MCSREYSTDVLCVKVVVADAFGFCKVKILKRELRKKSNGANKTPKKFVRIRAIRSKEFD